MKQKYMKENPSLYLVAPSFGCVLSPYKEKLELAVKNMKEKNFRITEGKNIYLGEGLASSNTPEKRGEEINEAFSSDADIVWSVGGGEVMCEILPYVDFKNIRKHPKWFVGFSDNTFLTYTITTMTGLPTIYGKNFPAFFKDDLEMDAVDTLEMLKGKLHFEGYGVWARYDKDADPMAPLNLTEKTEIVPVNYSKPFEGILLGGCLDCLQVLCGTDYDVTRSYTRGKKIIFYLEACDLTSVGIKRALFQLKNAGWFDNAVGFLIGRTFNFDDESFGFTPKEAYIDSLVDYGVPMLLDVDLGHLSPSLPMKNGVKVKVTYDKKIILDYED